MRVKSDAAMTAAQLGITVQEVSRWRKKLNDPAKFETTYEQAISKYAKWLEFDTTAHVGQNSGENDWYTPTEYIDREGDPTAYRCLVSKKWHVGNSRKVS